MQKLVWTEQKVDTASEATSLGASLARSKTTLEKRAGDPRNGRRKWLRRAKIDKKSAKIASWVALGARKRLRDAPGRAREQSGRARERSERPKSRPRDDLGAAGGSQERPGTAQKSLRAASKTLPDDPEALPERVWCAGLWRTRSRNDFSSILHGCAEAPMCRKYSSCQCFVHFQRS